MGRSWWLARATRKKTPLAMGLLFVALFFITPATEAQAPSGQIYELETTVIPEGRPIVPARDLGTAVLDLTVTCKIPVYTIEPQRIHLHIETDQEGTKALLNKTSLLLDRDACITLGTAIETQVSVSFWFPEHFPALESTKFKMTATHENEKIHSIEWNETAGHFDRWHLELDHNVHELELNQTLMIHGTVSSWSNAPIRLQIELEDPPELGILIFPDQVELGYELHDVRQEKPITIEYTRTAEGIEDLTLSITGRFQDTPTETLEPDKIDLRIYDPLPDKDPLAEIPAPWPFLAALIGLLLLALLGRRRVQ